MKMLNILVVGLAMGFAGSSVGGDAKNASAKTQDKKQAKIRDINKDPQKWMNKQVSLNGEIESVSLDSKAFVLDGDGFFNDQILVVSQSATKPQAANKDAAKASAATANVKEDNEVQVSGVIRRMNVMEIEREYSLDLDPQLELEFEGSMPVLVTDFSNMKVLEAE